MNACPHCKRPAISRSRKATLGPAGTAHCRHCGRLVSVPSKALLTVIPFLASIIFSAGLAPDPWLLGLVAVAIGALIMFSLHDALVPLVACD